MTLSTEGVVYVDLPGHDEPYPLRFAELTEFQQGYVWRSMKLMRRDFKEMPPAIVLGAMEEKPK